MPSNLSLKNADTLVIFGEQFSGGYINGLIQAAQDRGMQIIYSTVGRRMEDGTLRKLNAEELKPWQNKSFINIPLEAGFDMEPSDKAGLRPVDLCNQVGLKNWEQACLDKEILKSARQKASISFQDRVDKWLNQLTALLPPKGDVWIAHTMAGGVPRSRVFMPILNRILKGSGNRFFSSEIFWKSDLGQLCRDNFSEVTAQTYKNLIERSQNLRGKLQAQGRKVFYTAYSYHGTEVLIGDSYKWQSYSPYLQGFAKLELECISQAASKKTVNTYVFNVPEILTKSSAVFPGVEIPLYTLLGALNKSGGAKAETLISQCLQKLKPDALNRIMRMTEEYFLSPAIQQQSLFKKWPQHNTPEHIDLMLKTSQALAELHKDISQNITPLLSQAILESCGRIMFKVASSANDSSLAVTWIGHKEIAQNIVNLV